MPSTSFGSRPCALRATSEDAPQSTSSLPFAVALVSVAAGADLFVIECFAYSGELPGLAHLDEVRAAGALVAEDGAVIDL